MAAAQGPGPALGSAPATLPPPVRPEFPCTGKVGNRTFKHVVDVDHIGDAMIVYHIEPQTYYDDPATYMRPVYTVFAQGLTKTLTCSDFTPEKSIVSKKETTDDDDRAEYTECKLRSVGRHHWRYHNNDWCNPNWCLPDTYVAGHIARKNWLTYDATQPLVFERLGPADPIGEDTLMLRGPTYHHYFNEYARLLRYVVRRGVFSKPIAPPPPPKPKTKTEALPQEGDAAAAAAATEVAQPAVKRARKA